MSGGLRTEATRQNGVVNSALLTGRLLVATPQTGGDVFRRSVVLLLHHDEEGAQGIVLNRPLEADVRSVLPTWQAHVTPPGRLFQGGPVGLDSALGLVTVPATWCSRWGSASCSVASAWSTSTPRLRW